MQNKKAVAIMAIALLLAAVSPVLAATKINRSKLTVTEIDGYAITATKGNATYTINAERATLKNAKEKSATLDQFFVGDQIDVSGTRGDDGIIIAKIIKDRSLKTTDLTRRNVGSDNLADNAISDLNFISNGIITEDKLKAGTITDASIADNASINPSKINLANYITNDQISPTANISASKLNLANAITGADIQNGAITSDKLADGITIATGNFTTLDLGTNTITDGNFNGNWSFNGGTLSNINTLTTGTANVTTLDLGTNTVSDGSLNGNWDLNGGNLSNVGTIGSGDITSSGTVTANGSENNYFAGNVGIGTTNPGYELDVAGDVNISNSNAIRIGGIQVLSKGNGQLSNNLFVGNGGGSVTATGDGNVSTGINALMNNTTGHWNVAIGNGAGQSNTTGSGNIVVGTWAFGANTTGTWNAAFGLNALAANTTAGNNTAVGNDALETTTTGGSNTAVGVYALGLNNTGSENTTLGMWAGYLGASFRGNTLVGFQAGRNTSGNYNIALGYNAGANSATGAQNITIGYNINIPSATGSNQLNIGNLIYGTNVDGTGANLSSGNIGIGTTAPAVKLDVNGEVKLKKNSAQPYACDAAHDAAVSLTNKYTTCVCKNGTGWVLTADGTTACTWN